MSHEVTVLSSTKWAPSALRGNMGNIRQTSVLGTLSSDSHKRLPARCTPSWNILEGRYWTALRPAFLTTLDLYRCTRYTKRTDPQLTPSHLCQSSHTWKTPGRVLGVRTAFVSFISALSSIKPSNLVNKLETLGRLCLRIWDFSQTLTCQNRQSRLLYCYPQHRLHPSLQTYQPFPSGRLKLIKTWTICLKMAGSLQTDINIWLWLFKTNSIW